MLLMTNQEQANNKILPAMLSVIAITGFIPAINNIFHCNIIQTNHQIMIAGTFPLPCKKDWVTVLLNGLWL